MSFCVVGLDELARELLPRVLGGRGLTWVKDMGVVELVYQLMGDFIHVLDVYFGELIQVIINLSFPWLINLWRGLFYRQLYVVLNFCS